MAISMCSSSGQQKILDSPVREATRERLRGVSVVVPTHGRVELVKRLLRSLSLARSRYTGPSEVLTIDSSSPADAEAIASACTEQNACYIAGPANVRQKRNLGIAESKYQILLFVDSDCEAHPELLRIHAQAYDQEPNIGGVLGLTEFTGPIPWHWRIIEYTPFLNAFSFARDMLYAAWGTCSNLSVSASVLERVGVFDEEFPFRLGGDDLDLTWRISRSGHALKCVPEAVVYHARETWGSIHSVIRRAWRWGRMEHHLLNRHPELRFPSMPRRFIVFSLLVVLSVLRSVATGRLTALLLPVAWLVTIWMLDVVRSIHIGRRTDLRSPYYLLSRSLAWIYTAGAMFEHMRRRDWRGLGKRMLFDYYQLQREWEDGVWNAYSTLVGFAAMIILVPFT